MMHNFLSDAFRMNNLEVVIIHLNVIYLASLYSMLGSVLGTENMMVDKIWSFPSKDSYWTERTFWNQPWELYALNIPDCSLFSEYLKIHSPYLWFCSCIYQLRFLSLNMPFSKIIVSMQSFKSQTSSKNFLSLAFCSTRPCLFPETMVSMTGLVLTSKRRILGRENHLGQ